jgi:DNA invertase Pin-like site-specific DNA recombinase
VTGWTITREGGEVGDAFPHTIDSSYDGCGTSGWRSDHSYEYARAVALAAQRESAEAYIKSRAHEGWRVLRERFDDGGFCCGSMERPALQKLLQVIRERRIDIIVVYKVDRLTRSLADFAKLVDLFDAYKVSFVSVTQAFNTTSSMGRLTSP